VRVATARREFYRPREGVMSDPKSLNDELDEYEEQMGEIAQVLLDDHLSSEAKLEEIESIVFPDNEEEE
jgi:hypothetical protein